MQEVVHRIFGYVALEVALVQRHPGFGDMRMLCFTVPPACAHGIYG